jgi:hypothetical protein
LFDYFDPLLSPHAYPNGVSPDNKPVSSTAATVNNSSNNVATRPTSRSGVPFGINYYSSVKLETVETNDVPQQQQQQQQGRESDGASADLFDYFDPLLSPHAYPNGVSPDNPAVGNSKPRGLEVVTSTGQPDDVSTSSGYNNKKKVGILLMDHGSRNEASNARLQAMARLYQLNLDTTMENGSTSSSSSSSTSVTMIVRAAHMEIAKPSIPDGLQTLIDAGVDEIVCHPYFLSPGRHVMEDIPEIIDGAIRDMNIRVPVRTTDPVGSNTQMMLGLIHSSVTSTSQVLQQGKQEQQRRQQQQSN